MEEHKLVFLGDYHLHEFYKLKKDKDLKFSNSEENTFWYTDPEFTVRHVKKKFSNHILQAGLPDVVVVGVGGKDLTFRRKVCCVISSIIRLWKFLLKSGVKAVVLLSLLQRNLPLPYNNDVKKINIILATKAKSVNGLYFLPYTRKPNFTDGDYTNGILLLPHFYSQFYHLLNKLLTNKVLPYINSPEVLNEIQKKKPFGDNIMELAETLREEETDLEVAELTKEIEDLISSFAAPKEKKKQKQRKKTK